MIRLACWFLAVAATGTAICLSVLAGWQRGGSLAERLVWVAIGVVLVACAHLLPALVREVSVGVRGVAGVLWLACMAAACFGHASFFLLAQRHAGELRVTAVPVAVTVSLGRSLTAVMAERAAVTALLATANVRRCSGNCTTLEARKVTLTAKLDALDAETGGIRRQQSADDRAEARRDALVADPVTARLAALLGTTATRVDLLSGLAFAAVLEGVACLLWTVTLRSQPPVTNAPVIVTAVRGSHPPVMESHIPESGSHQTESESYAPDNKPVTPLPEDKRPDPDVTQLALDVAAGQVRPTVADIRRHLGCSQARAAALRRQLALLDST
ncbi:hypothetical protein GO285_01261 [Ralstonia solanacearum]|nr:hypothetical protein [Ralstonia solanacearum]NKF94171.1 hypothetical protein [Ralstonia solanacearum]NKG09550.1 hypothetical protein [Ralstonia solanacearum]